MDSADNGWVIAFKFCKCICKFTNKQISEFLYSLRNSFTFADCVYKFCGFHLYLRIPLTFFGICLQLRNPEQLAIIACCGIRNKLNVPTKFTLQVYVRGIHVSLVSWIHSHFGTCLNTCLWNSGTRDIQTQNCAPIQCTVWPRNESLLGLLGHGFWPNSDMYSFWSKHISETSTWADFWNF